MTTGASGTGDVSGPPAPAGPRCYRHPQRETWVRCTRCDRPICPDCMIPASVGFQCPECVRAGQTRVRPARTLFGGRVSDDPGWVSKILLGGTVAMYLLQQLLGGGLTQDLWMVGLARDPVAGDLDGVAAGEWYRLLTAAVLHGSLLHLAFNMYALWLFGPPLEAAFGRVRFTAVYLLSALGGSALSYAFSPPNQPSVGASGAIFGLFAAYMVVGRRLGRDISALVVLLVLNGVLGFVVPTIDWRAHAGGFLTGGLAALVLVYAPRARRSLVQVVGLVALAGVVLAGATTRSADLAGSSPARVLGCVVTAPVDPDRTYVGCLQSS